MRARVQWSFMGEPQMPRQLATTGVYALLRHPQGRTLPPPPPAAAPSSTSSALASPLHTPTNHPLTPPP